CLFIELLLKNNIFVNLYKRKLNLMHHNRKILTGAGNRIICCISAGPHVAFGLVTGISIVAKIYNIKFVLLGITFYKLILNREGYIALIVVVCLVSVVLMRLIYIAKRLELAVTLSIFLYNTSISILIIINCIIYI
ncbi:hypothetical protein ACJX0J_009215, partial [Zea mays]